MAQIGVSITKRTAFRDSTQEFSNVYHYGSVEPWPTAGQAEGIIDEIVAEEQKWHSTSVEFVYARCWSSGGTTAENNMITEKALAVVGLAATAAYIDRERAFLVMWPAGLDSRGKKVYLRKWYHTCGIFPGVMMPDGISGNTTGFSEADRGTIATAVDAITRVGNLEEWGLVAKSGRERDGGPPIAHRYFEHHQMGDQWRG